MESKPCPSKFSQVYDSYFEYAFQGGLASLYLEALLPEEKEKLITTGYAVNKDPSELSYSLQSGHYFYFVFDHIRRIEETLAGIFKSDNKEFNQILRPFLREFMFAEIYVVYSEEFKNYELQLLEALSIQEKTDPIDRRENAYPECNFRLLRRVPKGNGEWQWDAILSGINNIEFTSFPEDKTPIKCTFNRGFYFRRLIHIFQEYESCLQIFKRLMVAIPKLGDINAEDAKAVKTKIKQLQSIEVFSHTLTSQPETSTTIDNIKLFEHMQNLTAYYDLLNAWVNDQLTELGIAGDDSTKAERITTGENFRALQPNTAYQQTILNELETFTYKLEQRFKQKVVFSNNIISNEQGIPESKNQEDINKPEDKQESQDDQS